MQMVCYSMNAMQKWTGQTHSLPSGSLGTPGGQRLNKHSNSGFRKREVHGTEEVYHQVWR